jgi:hypothetical protein
MTPAQLKSSPADWSEFEVEDSDLEFIYSLLLEREVPLTPREMALSLIEHRLARLQEETARLERAALPHYAPGDEHSLGQQLIFRKFGNRVGTVVGIRPGDNPELGEFRVIRVEFDQNNGTREFASGLADHGLNQAPAPAADVEVSSPETLLKTHGERILSRITSRLEGATDIVRIAGRWFPGALLAEINEGHLNLAEAVLDVAGGGPLPTRALMEHLETPKDLDPLLTEFSLDYALQEDERFDEVGPAGQVLWYLRRLEPPEVLTPPARLDYNPLQHDRHRLTEPLLAAERELDDEHSPLPPANEEAAEVTLPLLFPHWQVGALPLSARLQPLFPTAYEAPRIRFILVDGHSGEKFPGWVVRAQRYVYGLDHFFRRHHLPAGGLVRVRLGEQQGEVVVEVVDRRQRNDWIRTVTLADSGRIGFTMLKQPVGAAYDDLMVVGVIDPSALAEAWANGDQRKQPLDRLVTQVFRELSKLNPQAAVHCKALYSAVNVIRRVPPGPIFAELVTQPHYSHVGDAYWRIDESQRKDA